MARIFSGVRPEKSAPKAGSVSVGGVGTNRDGLHTAVRVTIDGMDDGRRIWIDLSPVEARSLAERLAKVLRTNTNLIECAVSFESQAAHCRRQAALAKGASFPHVENYIAEREEHAALFEGAAVEYRAGAAGPAVAALKARGLA